MQARTGFPAKQVLELVDWIEDYLGGWQPARRRHPELELLDAVTDTALSSPAGNRAAHLELYSGNRHRESPGPAGTKGQLFPVGELLVGPPPMWRSSARPGAHLLAALL